MLIIEFINKRICMKKTPAQKIRDYLKLPLKDSYIKNRKEKYGTRRQVRI